MRRAAGHRPRPGAASRAVWRWRRRSTTTASSLAGPIRASAPAPSSRSPRRAANAPSAADESAWNQDISQAPLDPNSASYIAYINAHGGDFVHPDFGSPREYGFPYAVVGKKQRRTKVNFTAYGDESTHGAYRVPLKALVEGGQASDGDRHVLAVDRKRCKLFELYRAFAAANGPSRTGTPTPP